MAHIIMFGKGTIAGLLWQLSIALSMQVLNLFVTAENLLH